MTPTYSLSESATSSVRERCARQWALGISATKRIASRNWMEALAVLAGIVGSWLHPGNWF